MEILGSLGELPLGVVRSLFCFQGVPAGPRSRFAGHGALSRTPESNAWLEPSPATFPLILSLPLENCIASTSIFVLPSYKEPTVDALASTTDEGRG